LHYRQTGSLYLWGSNKNGECGNREPASTRVGTADFRAVNISAGNGTTILQAEDKKIYVLGNNANGQIGLKETKATYEVEEINVGKEIENISAGAGTHSALIDKEGFIWHTGTNINGELGLGENENKTEFVKNGRSIIKTNFEKKYVEKDEKNIITARLENTFNLKFDLIDDNQENFHLETEENTKVAFNKMEVTAIDYGTAYVKVIHNNTNVEKEIQIIVTIKIKSIVQGFRDMDLPDGEYSVVVENQPYIVELINYYDDMRYSLDTSDTETSEKIIELGDDSTEYKTLVVKYHKNLTVDEGVTLTAKRVNNLTYKKGMYICALGNIYNEGNITMTAHGTYNQEGENVYLWENIDNSYEYVPALGGVGGQGIKTIKNQYKAGNKGADGTLRATGGGGSGDSSASDSNPICYSGSGSQGTSYSGGSGGGGVDGNFRSGSIIAENAKPNRRKRRKCRIK